MRNSKRRPAFTLLEMIVVMWGLGFLFLLGGAILAGALRMQQANAATQERLTHRAVLADQFRADVHQATALPEHAGTWTASQTCLILQQAHGKQIVYYWKDRLERIELPAGQAQRFNIGDEHTRVEFLRPDADCRLAALWLVRTWPKKSPIARVSVIAAAPGGDLR